MEDKKIFTSAFSIHLLNIILEKSEDVFGVNATNKYHLGDPITRQNRNNNRKNHYFYVDSPRPSSETEHGDFNLINDLSS